MAQQFLQGTKIGAPGKHVARKCVPQHVRRDAGRGDTGAGRELLERQGQALARKVATTGWKQPAGRRRRRPSGVADIQPRPNRVAGRLPEGESPFLVAFPDDGEGREIGRQRGERSSDQL